MSGWTLLVTKVIDKMECCPESSHAYQLLDQSTALVADLPSAAAAPAAAVFHAAAVIRPGGVPANLI